MQGILQSKRVIPKTMPLYRFKLPAHTKKDRSPK